MQVQRLAEVFNAPGEKQQRKLIESLGTSQAAFQVLVQTWNKHPRPAVRRWVAEALCADHGPESTSLVRAALEAPEMSVRLHAIAGAVAHNRIDLLPWISPLLNDESGAIRQRALDAVVALGLQPIEPILLAASMDEKAYVRARALQYLRRA